MLSWFRNVWLAVNSISRGMFVTLAHFVQTFRRQAFTQRFAYPENPVPVRPRYRGFHRFDLTACIGCEKCARACPVDAVYLAADGDPFVCIHCGRCVPFCPHDCLEHKELGGETAAAETAAGGAS